MKHFVFVIKEESLCGRVRVRIGTSKKPPFAYASNVMGPARTWNSDKLSLEDDLTREYQTEHEAKDVKKCVEDKLKSLHIRGCWYKPEALGMLPDIFDDCE